MKKLFSIMVVLCIMLCAFSVPAFSASVNPPASEDVEQVIAQTMSFEWTYTIAAMSVLILLITELLKRMLPLAQPRLLAIIVSVALSYAAWLIDMYTPMTTMFESLNWWLTGLVGLVFSFMASGMFSTDMGKKLLIMIGLRPRDSRTS